MGDGLLKIEDAATLVGMSISYLYKIVSKKQIRHVRCGRRVLFKKEDLDDFVREHTIEVQVAKK